MTIPTPEAVGPKVDSVAPSSGKPGAHVDLAGTSFGQPAATSRVTFTLASAGAPAVTAQVVAWAPTKITVVVPDTASLGSGGPATLTVTTSAGKSSIGFTVLEAAAPTLASVAPASGTAGTKIVLAGSGFGRERFAGHAVLVAPASGPPAEAAVVSWAPTQIQALVPDPSLVGGAGAKAVSVRTLWGTSGTRPLTVLDPLVASGVTPTSALPGDVLTISGSGFGPAGAPGSRVEISAPGKPAVMAEVVSWTWTSIRVLFPPDASLADPGPKQLVVRRQDAASAPLTVTREGPLVLTELPVALLPVRLETRFSPDRSQLLVRIFPDDVHVDSFEPELTAAELAAAQAFAAAKGAARDEAWRSLVDRFGGPRGAWLAEALARGDPGSRTDVWMRAPRTRVLPSRWYALGYGAGEEPLFEVWGQPVPDELAVGPDPHAPPPPAGDPTRPAVDPGIRWIVDFDEAVAKGVALRIPLPQAARAGLRRLVVVGVNGKAGSDETTRRVGDLLRAHRFTRGLAFLPEGTPTNASAAAPAGSAAPDGPPPAADPYRRGDGSNRDLAARLLGLDDESVRAFAATPHGTEGADLRAGRRSMNAALWPATWGYFLEHLMAPVVPEDAIAAARAHFVDWVRAAGVPTLAVGRQPYGLAVVAPLAAAWTPPAAEGTAGLLQLLGSIRPAWEESVGQVPHVGMPPEQTPSGTDDPLLTSLSLQPVSTSYRGRSVLGEAYVDAAWRFMREALPPEWWTAQRDVARAALDAFGLTWDPNVVHTVFAKAYFDIGGAVVQDGPTADGLLAPNYLQLLAGDPRPGYREVRDERFPGADTLPARRPLLYLVVRHSLLVEHLFVAGRLDPAAEPWRGGETELFGLDEYDDDLQLTRPPSTWDRLEEPFEGTTKGDYLDANDVGSLADVRAAVKALGGLPAAMLERLFAETLDLCSHRFDAWATSLAARRLEALRGARAFGVHLGGYGFVEDLAPRGEEPGSAGYVLAPSQAHATTAALLASGHLAHGQVNGEHPFAVDLSSERVRLALSLLDGVRAGHSLGSLLGYRFERGMQEARLARFVDDFRAFAPLTVVPGSDPAAVGEQNVVDGLALHRAWVAAGRTLGRGWPGLEARAEVERELRGLDDAVDAVGDALLAEAVHQTVRGNPDRAAAALDAASGAGPPPAELDVVESPRSGIALTHRLAVLLPAAPPTPPGWAPDPAMALRRRAEPLLDAWAGKLLGDPKRVRFRVEYRDDAGATTGGTELRLDQIVPPLSPLDVVYAAVANEPAQRSEIEERILYFAQRTRPPTAPGKTAVLVPSNEPESPDKVSLVDFLELARSIREAIRGARPLAPADLVLPGAAPTPALAADELEQRAAGAQTALSAVADALDAALAGGTSEPLRTALLRASAAGVPGAVPLSAVADTAEDRAELGLQAAVAVREARRRLAEAAALPPAGTGAESRRDRALAAIRALLGPAFVALPRLTVTGSDPSRVDLAFPAGDALQGGDRLAATTWFQRVARVRDGARRLGDALTEAEALGGVELLSFSVGQLPARAGDRWIGLPLDPAAPPAGRLSVVAHLPLGPLPAGQPFAGLLVEELAEVVPSAEETVSVAFGYDRPGATAPQAILVGVPPPGQAWSLGMLEATVVEALDLARLRMVDLDVLTRAGQLVPSLYFGLNLKGQTVATDLKNATGIRPG